MTRRGEPPLQAVEDVELCDLLGPDWKDCWIRGGRWLALPGWRRAFEAHELRTLFLQVQEAAWLRAEIRRLQIELERRSLEADQAEARAAFYRRQCVLESRLGLMLAKLAA